MARSPRCLNLDSFLWLKLFGHSRSHRMFSLTKTFRGIVVLVLSSLAIDICGVIDYLCRNGISGSLSCGPASVPVVAKVIHGLSRRIRKKDFVWGEFLYRWVPVQELTLYRNYIVSIQAARSLSVLFSHSLNSKFMATPQIFPCSRAHGRGDQHWNLITKPLSRGRPVCLSSMLNFVLENCIHSLTAKFSSLKFSLLPPCTPPYIYSLFEQEIGHSPKILWTSWGRHRKHRTHGKMKLIDQRRFSYTDAKDARQAREDRENWSES